MRASILFFALSLMTLAGCGTSTTRTDDVGAGVDAPGVDAPSADLDAPSVGVDAPSVGLDAPRVSVDAPADGPACSESVMGFCADGLDCMGCPAGPIMDHYVCTTACASDTDCTDAARPTCSIDTFGGATTGLCVPPGFGCTWGAVCASPDTMIATPSGERRIDEIIVGDLVYSSDHGALVAVHVRGTARTPVFDHRVVRVTLATGRVIEMSPGHPTADGRFFGDLRGGEALDGIAITDVELVPFGFAYTVDLLPDSDTATYVASGALVGSTLAD